MDIFLLLFSTFSLLSAHFIVNLNILVTRKNISSIKITTCKVPTNKWVDLFPTCLVIAHVPSFSPEFNNNLLMASVATARHSPGARKQWVRWLEVSAFLELMQEAKQKGINTNPALGGIRTVLKTKPSKEGREA